MARTDDDDRDLKTASAAAMVAAIGWIAPRADVFVELASFIRMPSGLRT